MLTIVPLHRRACSMSTVPLCQSKICWAVPRWRSGCSLNPSQDLTRAVGLERTGRLRPNSRDRLRAWKYWTGRPGVPMSQATDRTWDGSLSTCRWSVQPRSGVWWSAGGLDGDRSGHALVFVAFDGADEVEGAFFGRDQVQLGCHAGEDLDRLEGGGLVLS